MVVNAHNDPASEHPQQPALLEAVERGELLVVEELLDQGVPIQGRPKSQPNDALVEAACCRQFEVLELLIHRGADPNFFYYQPALKWAAVFNHTKMARLLLEHGAEAEALSTDFETPLMAACTHGNVDMAKLLIEHGAQLRTKSKAGGTPMLEAQIAERRSGKVNPCIALLQSLGVEKHPMGN